jgi:hypothetical protein
VTSPARPDQGVGASADGESSAVEVATGPECDCKPRSPSASVVGVDAAASVVAPAKAASAGAASLGTAALSGSAVLEACSSTQVGAGSVVSDSVAVAVAVSLVASVPSVGLSSVSVAWGAIATLSIVHELPSVAELGGVSVAAPVPSVLVLAVESIAVVTVSVGDVSAEELAVTVVSLAVAEMSAEVSKPSVVVAGVSPASDVTPVVVVVSGEATGAVLVPSRSVCPLGAGDGGSSSAMAVATRTDVEAEPTSSTDAQAASRNSRRPRKRGRPPAGAPEQSLDIAAFISE